jgi:hypothetical protein
MTEKEIFEKLKEALDYKYLYDSWNWSDEQKEVDNLEDYLILIKQERALEKDLNDAADDNLHTYKEFVSYLADKAIGNTEYIIEEFTNCTYVGFEGYKKVTKEVKDNDIYLIFQVGELTFKAKWQDGDNYAVWQTCGYTGDDYSGYMLFPTHTKDEYFCVSYWC